MTYISKDFQVGYLSYYRLLIGVQYGFDQICVLDEQQSVVACFRYDPANPPYDVLSLLSLPFPRVDIIVPSQNSSLVPQEVYDPADMETYAEYLELKSRVDVSVREIDDFGVNVLYQLDPVVYHRWKKVYPEAHFVPGFSALFELAASYKQESGAMAFIQFGGGDIVDILITKDGSLLFFNSFIVRSGEDLVYYLLQIQKQSGLTAPFQKIHGIGRIVRQPWFSDLSGYCAEIVANDEMNLLEFPEELDQETTIDIHHLFYNVACGSFVAK